MDQAYAVTSTLSYNKDYDESFVVSELDERVPDIRGILQPSLAKQPNFMIRKGIFKLIITKKADSTNIDMLYNLRDDPYEMNNLLGQNGGNTSQQNIGKAECLKILLVEWMKRNDGPGRYYSDPKWNGYDGKGDIQEISKRRSWNQVNYWQSDYSLKFGTPVLISGQYVRYEYLYIGRTSPGVLTITDLQILGKDGDKFTLLNPPNQATIASGGYRRFKISFASRDYSKDTTALEAQVMVYTNEGKFAVNLT